MRLLQTVRRVARSLRRLVAECYSAQRRMERLRQQPDLYGPAGDRPPENYAEFLFRSPVTMWEEPSAAERGRERVCRR
jgi:hypothetical protein